MHSCMCMPNVTFLQATITAVSSIVILFDMYFSHPLPQVIFSSNINI